MNATAPTAGREDRARRWIGLVLRAGVSLSASIVLLGAAIYLGRHGAEQPYLHVFRGEPEALREVGGVFRAAPAMSGRAIIQLGLLVLIATPVARVALSMAAFALQRDRLYVAISAVVLALLLLGWLSPT